MVLSCLLRNVHNMPGTTLSAQAVFQISLRGKKTGLWARKRKPLSLGRAPSKNFDYFKKRWPTDKDLIKSEVVYTTYNRLMQSLACCFQQDLLNDRGSDGDWNEFEWDEKSHHQLCMSVNDAENAELCKQNMAAIAKRLEEQESRKIIALQSHNVVDELKKIQKESEEWLNKENMSLKIEEALDNPVNFNFAVYSNGMIASRIAQTV